uniref:Ig-like domain-containing protein n=1 Tax=Poecilia mexicana TaxID=48701 RepID=A0A3B3WHR6_9TELE
NKYKIFAWNFRDILSVVHRIKYHARICALKGSSVSFYSSFNSYYSSDFVILFWFSPGRSKEPEDLRQDPRYLGRVHVINTIPQSTLTIKNLTENDSAEYRFIFKTNRVTWGSDLHGTTLTVTDLQVEVTRTSTNQDPQYAELKCHSRCTPAGYHYYRWFRNGQDIGHSKSTYKVLINTTDRISCSVLSFKEHKAPEVFLTSVSADPSDGIVEGNRVFLKCSSDANPPANYTWYKKTKMSAHPLHRKDSEFYLNPIQASDSGEYFCVAKNQLGESRSGNLNIDVKYAPKRADVSLSHAEIVEGDSVNLTCSSDGNPAPFNRWYKDNQMMLQGQGGVYQFTFVKSEDSGTYCCEVGNIYGWINSSTCDFVVVILVFIICFNINLPSGLEMEILAIMLCIYMSVFILCIVPFKNKFELKLTESITCDYLSHYFC